MVDTDSVRPVQVLEFAQGLQSRLADSRYQNYVGDTMSGNLRKHEKEASYIGLKMCEIEQSRLRQASMFHVSSEMLPLIRWGAETLPSDTVFTEDLFPTKYGFLMFESTWAVRTFDYVRPLRGFSWGPSLDSPDGGMSIIFYSDTKEDSQLSGPIPIPEEDQRWLGPLMFITMYSFSYGEEIGGSTYALPDGATEEDFQLYAERFSDPTLEFQKDVHHALKRTVYSILELMRQTVVSTSVVQSDRAQSKRLQRAKLDSQVTVVQLRRSQNSGRSESESMVEWTQRWVVRGHWRQQPHGSGMAQRKLIWIEPYVKGPEDLPLKVSQKVYTLRR